MEHRRLGTSGLFVPALSFGTATFGGGDQYWSGWGGGDAKHASRMIDVCLERGVNLFDCADSYSNGLAETILGEAIKGRRERVLISTKAFFPMSADPNDRGASRRHLITAIDRSLTRLGTDYIDIFELHGQDSETPVEETLATLDQIVRSGKVRYIGCSNYAGWYLMKSLAASDRYGYPRYIVHQAYYSLLDRDYEWELMPLAEDQGIGAQIWAPLGWGRLTGRIRRDRRPEPGSRAFDAPVGGPKLNEDRLYRIVDALSEIAEETGHSIPQIALNWVMNRPTVTTVLIGARNEQQLLENIGAHGWSLSAEHVARLDQVSAQQPSYPAWIYATGAGQ